MEEVRQPRADVFRPHAENEDSPTGLEAADVSILRVVQQQVAVGESPGTGASHWESGGGAAAGLGGAWSVDHAYARRSPTLAELMREFGPAPDPFAAPVTARGQTRGAATSSPIWEHFNSAVKMVRDAILDENDTASFSLAGIELNLTLRGDRRLLTINGHELSLGGSQGAEALRAQPAAARQSAAVAGGDALVMPYGGHDAAPEATVLLAQVRDLVFQPLTLLVVIAALALWVVLRVIHSTRDRQSW